MNDQGEGDTNAEVFIDFCQRLLHDTDRPLYLIVDGHPAHRATATKQFVASTHGRLILVFLPGYSPGLNLLSRPYLRRSQYAPLKGGMACSASQSTDEE